MLRGCELAQASTGAKDWAPQCHTELDHVPNQSNNIPLQQYIDFHSNESEKQMEHLTLRA